MDDGSRSEMDFSIIADGVTTSVMLIVLVLQVLSFRVMEVSRYVKTIILMCMSAMTIERVLGNTRKFLCDVSICDMFSVVTLICYVMGRILTFLFYIHRARTSQGISPVCADRCFTTIFPCILWSIGSAICVGTLVLVVFGKGTEWICDTRQSNIVEFKSCVLPIDDDDQTDESAENETNITMLVVVVAVELTLTFFFLYLFLRPLRHIYTSRDSAQKKLKEMVLINVVLTAIGMISSNIVEIKFLVGVGTFHFARFDANINIICIYLMLKRNRDYLRSLCRCCKRKPIRKSSISMKMPSGYSMQNLNALGHKIQSLDSSDCKKSASLS